MNHIITNVQPTMSSLEIASLVESRHDKVKQSIERLANRSVIQLPPLGEVRNHLGQMVSVYSVCKRDSYIVVAQLCPEFTARLVDRWQELEGGTHRLPQSMAEALRLAADQAEQIEQQQKAIDAARPAVEFASRVQVAHDAITVAEAAKTIGTGRTRLFAFLRHHGWVNRRNEPYQAKIEAGLMDVKISKWEHPEQGLKESITALITGKGLVKLQQLWEEQKGAAA